MEIAFTMLLLGGLLGHMFGSRDTGYRHDINYCEIVIVHEERKVSE